MIMMEIDYKALGLRVKTKRLDKALSQEQLAELANISVPHMSHIETGNTKVSLPTLIEVSNALNCGVDELICDSVRNAKKVFEQEIAEQLQNCTEKEIRLIADMVKALKQSYRRIEKYE